MWIYAFSHLQIDISNEKIKAGDHEKLKVNTIVENKGSIAKRIDFSFILITPENESFKNALQKITDSFGISGKNNEPLINLHLLTENKDRYYSGS